MIGLRVHVRRVAAAFACSIVLGGAIAASIFFCRRTTNVTTGTYDSVHSRIAIRHKGLPKAFIFPIIA